MSGSVSVSHLLSILEGILCNTSSIRSGLFSDGEMAGFFLGMYMIFLVRIQCNSGMSVSPGTKAIWLIAAVIRVGISIDRSVKIDTLCPDGP